VSKLKVLPYKRTLTSPGCLLRKSHIPFSCDEYTLTYQNWNPFTWVIDVKSDDIQDIQFEGDG
jgi:hypothetical protein